MIKWGDILTIQGQVVEIPLQLILKAWEIEHFPVLSLFSTCLSIKYGKPAPIKSLFSKLPRIVAQSLES